MQELYALELDDGIELINKALEKRDEEKAWELYVSIYPHFNKDTFISFEDFFKPSQKVTHKSEGDILLEVKGILDNLRG